MSATDRALQSIVGDALPGVYQIGRAESVAKDIRAQAETLRGIVGELQGLVDGSTGLDARHSASAA
jgi:hypothetical protein